MKKLRFNNVKIPGQNDLTTVTAADGIISKIGPAQVCFDCLDIDGRGWWLLPGAIDMHVHLREPGAEHKECIATGTRAAVKSGVTTVADMPNNNPAITTRKAFLDKCDLADRSALCDVRFFMALTPDNTDEIASVIGHARFAGIKVFLGATTGNLQCPVEAVIKASEILDTLFVFHAESNEVLNRTRKEHGPGQSAADHLTLRPVEAATESVASIVAAYRPGLRFHICHISTAAELKLISGHPGITCEASPHHLAMCADDTARLGNLGKMNPPLRLEADRKALLAAVNDGRVQSVATDHAPHLRNEKDVPYPDAPSGVPGLDTLVPFVLSLVQKDVMDINRAVEVMSSGPARLLGLDDRGCIRPGYRADFMLWDPDSTWNVVNSDIFSRCGWSPFSGMTLAGRPELVCYRGKIV